MGKFKTVINFDGPMATYAPSRNAVPVNTEWAGRAMDVKNILVPGAMDKDGKVITLEDFEKTNSMVRKHHKTAEQRSRQLERTKYIKGGSK